MSPTSLRGRINRPFYRCSSSRLACLSLFSFSFHKDFGENVTDPGKILANDIARKISTQNMSGSSTNQWEKNHLSPSTFLKLEGKCATDVNTQLEAAAWRAGKHPKRCLTLPAITESQMPISHPVRLKNFGESYKKPSSVGIWGNNPLTQLAGCTLAQALWKAKLPKPVKVRPPHDLEFPFQECPDQLQFSRENKESRRRCARPLCWKEHTRRSNLAVHLWGTDELLSLCSKVNERDLRESTMEKSQIHGGKRKQVTKEFVLCNTGNI